MVALRVEFLAGRYHATPWSRAVNEGDAEWPPEPWRILRALVAASYRIPVCDEVALAELIEKLSGPPEFYLPAVGSGHSRHYMPVIEGSNQKPVLVLDTFIAFSNEHEFPSVAYIAYPDVDLEPLQLAMLTSLCNALTYLGRAESWCSVRLVDQIPKDGTLTHIAEANPSAGVQRIVRRLIANQDFNGRALLRSLRESSEDTRRAKRLFPKGVAWAEYGFPESYDTINRKLNAITEVALDTTPCMLRFSLQGEQFDLLPSRYETLAVAEAMRAASMKRYSVENGSKLPTPYISGKASEGGVALGHDHAYYLPRDTQKLGVIDAIDVWFPKGVTPAEFKAISHVLKLYDPVVLKSGFAITFLGRTEVPKGRVWETVTPMVADRFPKANDSLSEQIQRALERRGFPPAEITIWDHRTLLHLKSGRRLRLDAFRKNRRGKTEPRPFVGATIRFETEVEGPISLGRLAHFGVGLFEPIVD